MDAVGAVAQFELETSILPYWLDRGIDPENGGFFTCFDNSGLSRLSTMKYSWSQGRFVWMLARAAGLATRGLLGFNPDELIGHAVSGAEFLVKFAVLDDGTCRYLLNDDGAVPAGYDNVQRSVSADCFVALGLIELARQTRDSGWLDLAEPIVTSAYESVASGEIPNAPYDLPSAFDALGPKMLLLNVWTEYVRALQGVSAPHQDALGRLAWCKEAVLTHRQDDGRFVEIRRRDGSPEETLLERHLTPGHILEALWMLVEASNLLGDFDETDDYALSAELACNVGWDTSYGGLFRYVDRLSVGQPSGPLYGSGYESLISRTWDTKLWWVHSEASYATALLSSISSRPSLAGWFERVWNYTLATFPSNRPAGEWVQIRDRQGRPFNEVVALPVKDPFHIARNLMQLIEIDHG